MEKAMEEIETSLTETFTAFMKDYLEEKKKDFEQQLEKQQMEFFADANPQIVYLNVGGKRFATTAKTLQRIPGSYLDKIVKGEVPIIKDKDGNIFLDKNGVIFEYILDYLRDKQLVYPDNPKMKKRMKEELKEMGLLEAKKTVKWNWDPKWAHGGIEVSNKNSTGVKKGNDGLGIISGTQRLDDGEYEWEIKVDKLPNSYWMAVGVFDKKTQKPQSFSYYNTWGLSSESQIYKLQPTHGLLKIKEGDILKLSYDADSGLFQIKVKDKIFKCQKIDSEKFQVYPYLYLHKVGNKATLTVL